MEVTRAKLALEAVALVDHLDQQATLEPPRHVQNWLERIAQETGLRFDTTTGWNRYAHRPWATFHELVGAALIAS